MVMLPVSSHLLGWPAGGFITPKSIPPPFALAFLSLFGVQHAVVQAENVDKVLPMTLRQFFGFPDVVNQVSVVTALPDGPQVDSSSLRARCFKDRRRSLGKRKGTDEI